MPAEPGAAPTWGLYSLANDAVLHPLIALLESLSRFAPELRVYVIPFDDRLALVRDLARIYPLELFDDFDFAPLDALGTRFYGNDRWNARGFRKLAAFAGPAERFFFADSDVVALSPLAALRMEIERSDAELVYFDIDLDQAYRPGPFRDELVESCGSVGFAAGLFASRRGALDPKGVGRALEALGPNWTELVVPNAEQGFLNLAVDRAGLVRRGAYSFVERYCSTCWAGAGAIVETENGFVLDSPQRWDHGWSLYFAHWAGFRLSPAMPNASVYEGFLEKGLARIAAGSR